MLFPKRQDYIIAGSAVALGTTLNVELSREFPIEKIVIQVTGTASVAMTTPLADGLQNILNRATLTVSDGAQQRTVVDVSGPGLLEYAAQIHGLDRQTKSYINTNAAAAFEFNYPIFFCLPNTTDPIYSALLLPVNRFNQNPKLQIKISSLTEMCASGFTVPAGVTVRVRVYRRQVLQVNWPVWNADLIELTKTYSAAGVNQDFELPIPGAYTGILLRGYTSTTARGDITAASGEWKLQLLGTTLRRFNLTDLQYENDCSIASQAEADDKFTASYFMDFLTDSAGPDASDFGSLFDTAGLQTTGAKPMLTGDIGGAYTLKAVIHRVYGNIAPLVRGRATAG